MIPGNGGGQVAGGDPAAAARCYRHPGREALVRCSRCDRPICPECMRPASVGFHCPDDVAAGTRSVRTARTTVGARLRNSPPYATATLVAANVVIFLITGAQSRQGFTQPSAAPIHGLFTEWQLFLPNVQDGEYYRLITSAFLHLSILHIASNMLALIIIGPAVERVTGAWRFCAIYFAGALGGSVAIYLFGAHLQPVVGASGAIFGLFGAALLMSRQLRLDLQWLIGIVVLNFVFTFSIADVSKLGHIGGFVAGGLAGLAIGGMPRRSSTLPVPQQRQVTGLAGVAVLLVLATILANATY